MGNMADMPLEFSVPYNGDPDTLEEIFKLQGQTGNRITEIYLSGPQIYCGSGRAAPVIDIEEFNSIIDRIHSQGIHANLVLNSTCEGIEWYKPDSMNLTMDYIKNAHEKHNLEAVTMANPLYISEIRKRFSDISISASVLCEINCVQRAMHYVQAGADVLSTDVNINRDLKVLKDIKGATGARLKILVNEGCLYRCPFRLFHFNAMSHASRKVDDPDLDMPFGDFFGACTRVVTDDAAEIFKSCWIRPEDVRKYSEITNYVKIVGRGQRKSMVVRSIQAYLQENWEGDLLDILSGACRKFSYHHWGYIKNKELEKHSFFEKVTTCGRNCFKCRYCEHLADDVVFSGMHSKEKMDDLGISN